MLRVQSLLLFVQFACFVCLPHEWQQLNPMPTARQRLMAALVGTEVYLCGGSTAAPPATRLSLVEKYSIHNDAWQTVQSMPVAVMLANAETVASEFFVLGGEGPAILNNVQKYNALLDTWLTATPIPGVRLRSVSASTPSSKILMAGGYVSLTGTTTAISLLYDAVLDAWTTVTSHPMSISSYGVTLSSGESVVCVGGMTGTTRFAEVFRYDLNTDEWAALASFPYPISASALGVVDNYLYAWGGSPSPLNQMSQYSVEFDTWTSLPNIPYGVFQTMGVVFERTLYYFGGNSGAIEDRAYKAYVPPVYWSTVSSMPTSASFGAVGAVGDHVLFVCGPITLQYDARQDQWTTLPARPVPATMLAVSMISPTTALVLGGILSPSEYTAVAHELTLTGVWTTRGNLPSDRARHASAFDGHGTVWVAVGWPANFALWEYTAATDSYTSRCPAPTSRESSGMAFDGRDTLAITGGEIAVSRVLELYSRTLDTWTTANQSPVMHNHCGHQVVGFAGDVYVMGGPGQASLERFTVSSGQWTTLQSAPSEHHRTGVVVTASGFLIAMDSYPSHHLIVEKFWTSFVARVVGDPLVTSFGGSAHHLSLWPGVFNLLTTPTITINAAVEEVGTLPPDENLVVTMVGVVAHLAGDRLLMVDCGLVPSGGFLCNEKLDQPKTTPLSLSVHEVSMSDRMFVLSTPAFTVEVHLMHRAIVRVVSPELTEVFPPSSWLDVVVLSHHANGLGNRPSGLLLDPMLQDHGTLREYEIMGGCLLP